MSTSLLCVTSTSSGADTSARQSSRVSHSGFPSGADRQLVLLLSRRACSLPFSFCKTLSLSADWDWISYERLEKKAHINFLVMLGSSPRDVLYKIYTSRDTEKRVECYRKVANLSVSILQYLVQLFHICFLFLKLLCEDRFLNFLSFGRRILGLNKPKWVCGIISCTGSTINTYQRIQNV